MVRKHPSLTDRVVRWATGPRAMEACLVTGGALATAGLAIDVLIFYLWISEPLRAMDTPSTPPASPPR
jgi:hypothetical protein